MEGLLGAPTPGSSNETRQDLAPRPRRLGTRFPCQTRAATTCSRSSTTATPAADHPRLQLSVEHWDVVVGDPIFGDAILDRVLNSAHRIALKGGSMRRLCDSPSEAQHLTTKPDPSRSSTLSKTSVQPGPLASESVDGLARNRWTTSLGLGGRLRRNRHGHRLGRSGEDAVRRIPCLPHGHQRK